MDRIFSRQNQIREMLQFEAALARAQAQVGLVPETAARAITEACELDTYDIDAIYRDAAPAGTLTIPLVKTLTEHVEPESRRFVHNGATSQDVMDTAAVRQIIDGLDTLEATLMSVADHCAHLSNEHRNTIMVGRTLLQQALPITFGLKTARWLSTLTRHIRQIREVRSHIGVVQFGGAAGTLASLGSHGLKITGYLAHELGLAEPDIPWHAERDRIAGVASLLGTIAGTLGKMGSDLTLLAQSEIAEVSESVAKGKGGSSALPHKRNPVDATMAQAAAHLAMGTVPILLNAMVQEHERAVGKWQAEWEALPNLFRYTAHAAFRIHAAVSGIDVNRERMAQSVEMSQGLFMAESLTTALAQVIGRHEAFEIVRTATRQAITGGRHLRDVAGEIQEITEVLDNDAIDRALAPSEYLGSTDQFIERVLKRYSEIGERKA